MIGQRLARSPRVDKKGFRWRGVEMGRMEALSDAVFGFAITLLVVSLEVPGTFSELLDTLRGLPSFAASFALLFLVWYNQYRFFRRYGLEDGVTILLNAVLLFVILFFVYPLKFVFQLVVAQILGPAWFPGGDRLGDVVGPGQGPLMMQIFGAGYVAVFAIFALLHVHAWRMRERLELNPLERHDTLDNLRESLLNAGVGMMSVAIATFGGSPYTFYAGICYWLVGPAMAAHGYWSGSRRNRLRKRLEAEGAAPGAAATPEPVPG
ncbi:MAG TPA: TMEM175 family protein [Longimicrobium sp.]|nr:TMEM175 family protein [Longimicrobium sp.]